MKQIPASLTPLTSSLQGNLLISVPRFWFTFLLHQIYPLLWLSISHLHIEAEFNDKKIDLLSEGYDLALSYCYMEDSLVSRKIGTTTVHFGSVASLS